MTRQPTFFDSPPASPQRKSTPELPAPPPPPKLNTELAHPLARVTREDGQAVLFDVGADWKEHWWGMPEFVHGDATPLYRISVNFMTYQDVKEFARRLGVNVSTRTDSVWFPPEELARPQDWAYQDESTPRYPIYIPSKGRHSLPPAKLTVTRLRSMGVPFRVVVEPTEEEEYARLVGRAHLLVLPFSDLGQGSIPARNWIWEHAKSEGHDFHWILDDNITAFKRLNNNRRIPVTKGGAMFRAAEAFVERYENVAIAGFQHIGFVPDREPRLAPFTLNTRVYSMSLIRTDLPHRWRGRYNEDTDLCLQFLKDGLVTLQFNVFMGNKGATLTMPGGNTDNVYNTGDHRREFAESLKRQHPDVVEVVWRYDRWHHLVDYSPFAGNALRAREGVVPTGGPDEFGMILKRLAEPPAVENGDARSYLPDDECEADACTACGVHLDGEDLQAGFTVCANCREDYA